MPTPVSCAPGLEVGCEAKSGRAEQGRSVDPPPLFTRPKILGT